MPRKATRQLQLSLGQEAAPRLPKKKEREVLEALAELLLAAAQQGRGDEGRDDDEREDHR